MLAPVSAEAQPVLATPAQRTSPPARVARVCLNGHLVAADLPAEVAAGAPTNRADPLAIVTGEPCPTCGVGTIVACPGCGWPIPAGAGRRASTVPHFCVVCGEYYPWTFLAEFYATLAEILEESPLLAAVPAHEALELLDRQRDGRASDDEVRSLTDTFRGLGGSDWDLAAQILGVVLPAHRRAGLDLRGAFSA
jgi:hypothetical protein